MKNPIYKYAFLLGISLSILMLLIYLTFIGLIFNSFIQSILRFLITITIMALAINEFSIKNRSKVKYSYTLGFSISSTTGFLGLIIFISIMMGIRILMDGSISIIYDFIHYLSEFGPIILMAAIVAPLIFVFRKNKFDPSGREDVLDSGFH